VMLLLLMLPACCLLPASDAASIPAARAARGLHHLASYVPAPRARERDHCVGHLTTHLMPVRFLLAALFVTSHGHAEATILRPRAHVMQTRLQSAATYERIAAENGGLGLRLLAKFADGLALRPVAGGSGVASELDTSRAHVRAVNRTLASLGVAGTGGAHLQPVLSGVGAEWEHLVKRAERLSGRAQPDLRALVEVHLPTAVGPVAARLVGQQQQQKRRHPPAAELVAAAEALAALDAVEYAEIEYSGMPPPAVQLNAMMGAMPLDCPVPPPTNTSTRPGTPDFTSLQGYYRSDPGFDAEWAAAQGADGAGVRYADCEYCWVFDHEDVEMIKEEGHPCDPNMFADHGTASVGVTTGIDNGFGILGIAPDTTAFTYRLCGGKPALLRSWISVAMAPLSCIASQSLLWHADRVTMRGGGQVL
jgi:hypothetical protein